MRFVGVTGVSKSPGEVALSLLASSRFSAAITQQTASGLPRIDRM
jgi:hypothetical protein